MENLVNNVVLETENNNVSKDEKRLKIYLDAFKEHLEEED